MSGSQARMECNCIASKERPGAMTFIPIPLCQCTHSFNAEATLVVEDLLPMHLNQATTYKHSNIITVMGHGLIDTNNKMSNEFNVKQFWDNWQCELMAKDNVDQLIQAIRQSKAVAVSDGSYCNQHRAAV